MRIYVIGFLFFLAACKSRIPDDVIEPGKMQAIYWDLMRADEWINYQSTADTSFPKTLKQDSFYTAIFQIHQISRDEFLRSKLFYELNPDLLKPILDSMHASGERALNAPEDPVEQDTVKQELPDSVNLQISDTIKKRSADSIIPLRRDTPMIRRAPLLKRDQ